MTHFQGECSLRRAEEQQGIQHWWSACSEDPPCLSLRDCTKMVLGTPALAANSPSPYA